MSDQNVDVQVTYRKPGTEPPLFIAGTFSDPQWVAQEMACTTDAQGKHVFEKTLQVPPGAHIQYKFRVGHGDWWVLNDDDPTETDPAGNRNNVLTAPDSAKPHTDGSPASEVSKISGPKPRGLAPLQDLERQRLSSTPIGQVADTAAEVADTARELDVEGEETAAETVDTAAQTKQKQQAAAQAPNGKPSYRDPFAGPDDDGLLDEGEDHEPPALFAHECFGAYDPLTEDDPESNPKEDHHGSVEYDVDKYDLNDPSLERWPSDRRSVVDAVRKVETGRNEDRTCFLGSPISPIIGSRSMSFEEEAVDSMSVGSPGPAQRLDVPRKKSQGSMVSQRSHISLASIAESEEDGVKGASRSLETDELGLPPVVRVPSPANQSKPGTRTSLGSDDDEGVVLKGSKKGALAKDAQRPESNETLQTKWSGNVPTQPGEPVKASGVVDARSTDRPNIQVQPPDEIDELEDTGSEADAAIGPAAGRRATPDDNGQLQEQDQGNDIANRGDRPVTPQSLHKQQELGGGNWLRAFFRVLFVDYIGGFFKRLFEPRK